MTVSEILSDCGTDTKIRAALFDADLKGKLSVVSAVIGPSVTELREIMNSDRELNIMERGMLGMHLLAGEVTS